ncbi:MAG: CocE/NonD family hydrolase [Thermodesulfobacteriota bacterium]
MNGDAIRKIKTSLTSLLRVAQSLWPILGNAARSGQLLKPQCLLTNPDPDILCEYDVKILVEDGFHLTANIFRSRRANGMGVAVPVIMCAHPYDNHLIPALGRTPLKGAPRQYRLIPQTGRPSFSTLTSWESPDPNFWVPAGYAVVNLNLPGYGGSEGPATIFSDHQAKSYYEAIEWVARQPWCTGKIGLSGVSFLAITQYHVAACRHYGGPPPSLRCISPWEGFTDMYRDMCYPGGMGDEGFGPFWWITEVKPALSGTPEDFIRDNGALPMDLLPRHPFFDEFWRERTPELEKIDLPMLVCASFSDHGLHSVGSFRAFMKVKSEHKWVYTHRTGKWDAYYSPEVLQLTKAFMDCFLKNDSSSGFLDTPPVRLEVRSSRDVIHEVRYEQKWPPQRTRYNRLFLEANPKRLAWQPAARGEVLYPARKGRATFEVRWVEDTELSGYMKLRLWVEARPAEGDVSPAPDDMAIFVAINKLDQRGQTVPFFGSIGNKKDMVTRGYCRVSRRELNPVESTEWHPVLTGTSHRPLRLGEVVAVEIELYPSSTFFAAGESLQLIISSDEIIPSPPYRKQVSYNRGLHVIHCGGAHDSHLLIPVIPAAG